MKSTIITALLALVALTASADIVKGRVVDAETKEPLPEAQVKFEQRHGDYGWSIMTTKADSVGCFSLHASGRGTIEASMLGYYAKTKPCWPSATVPRTRSTLAILN